MSLVECLAIALKNNLDLKSNFLDRITQKFDVKLARDQFNPRNLQLQLQSQRNSTYPDYNDVGRTTGATQTGIFTGTWKIPTGGQFNFNWQNQGAQADVSQSYSYTGQWGVTFTQPLLKGGGVEVATADLKKAYLQEEKNLLGLQDQIMQTINNTVTKYRQYLLDTHNLEISQNALNIAKKTMKTPRL